MPCTRRTAVFCRVLCIYSSGEFGKEIYSTWLQCDAGEFQAEPRSLKMTSLLVSKFGHPQAVLQRLGLRNHDARY
jgi:hypothetical protein